MSRSTRNLLVLGVMFVVLGVLFNRSNNIEFEQHTAHAGGLLSSAKIVSMEHEQHTTVEYTDEQGKIHRATIESGWDSRHKIGQRIQISYLPGRFNEVRWPKGRVSVNEYRNWGHFSKGCIIFGSLCLLFLAYKLFVRKESREGVIFTTGTNASYSLKTSPSRLMFFGFFFIFCFGLCFVILFLWLFYLSGLSLATAQVIFGAFVALFLMALWQAVVPKIGHPALRLDRQGFSIYDSGKIPWQEISEIRIQSHMGKVITHSLFFFLSPGSNAGPLATTFMKTVNPPRMRLSLENVCWEEDELREQLIRFALEGRDDDAIEQFRQPRSRSTGSINWPKENSGDSMNKTLSNAKKRNRYMGLGFHLRNH